MASLDRATAKFSQVNLRGLKITTAIFVDEISQSGLDILLQVS